MTRVLIIEPSMNEYRLPFYRALFAKLQRRQIDLQVAYSEALCENGHSVTITDASDAYFKKVPIASFFKGRLVWQSAGSLIRAADLVVVDHANRFLMNHLLLSASRLGLKRVAFWGHGKSPHSGSFASWYKRATIDWVDWWFAYTFGTQQYLLGAGVHPEQITVVNNSIDVEELRAQVAAISPAEIQAAQEQLGIPPSAPVGVFCGSFYDLKEVPFLLKAATLLRARVPEFHLILIGNGQQFNGNDNGNAVGHPSCIHFVGQRFGREKALYLRLADIVLIPGVVGLAILDAFAAGLPLVTRESQLHGPEMEYLQQGINGLLTPAALSDYVAAVSDILLSPGRLAEMKCAAQRSSRQYSIDDMATRFCEGVELCLNQS
jgi:L-malate glycosyltransferase